MGVLFTLNEGFNTDVLLNKGKILKWYEEQHKDLVPFKELEMKKYSKLSSGNYVETDKYMILHDIETIADLDSLLGTEAINCIGFECNEKPVFVLEAYLNGMKKVGPAPVPNFIHKYIGISSLGKKYKGYYLNRIKQQISLDDSIEASKFLKEQNEFMKNNKGGTK